jgi:hypothetical protein
VVSARKVLPRAVCPWVGSSHREGDGAELHTRVEIPAYAFFHVPEEVSARFDGPLELEIVGEGGSGIDLKTHDTVCVLPQKELTAILVHRGKHIGARLERSGEPGDVVELDFFISQDQ